MPRYLALKKQSEFIQIPVKIKNSAQVELCEFQFSLFKKDSRKRLTFGVNASTPFPYTLRNRRTAFLEEVQSNYVKEHQAPHIRSEAPVPHSERRKVSVLGEEALVKSVEKGRKFTPLSTPELVQPVD